MTREIRCEVCGGRLEAAAGGRFLCQDCGVAYSADRLRELAAETGDAPVKAGSAEAVPETAGERAGKPEPAADKEARMRQLEREQQRLLAEMRLADGVFGPARRRELGKELRRVERELARLQGRKWPWFF